jgi:hydroxyethylthiazole kinase-like uncharacterized protein yjeF
MKILSARQMREADAYTIANEIVGGGENASDGMGEPSHYESFQLMERASMKCAEWIAQKFDSGENFTIICGTGNNGGDGLCIAKLLHETGRKVEVLVLHSDARSADFTKAFDAAQASHVSIIELNEVQVFTLLKSDIVIDAIFGTGINRRVEGRFEEYIKVINSSGCEVVSIDLPSGLIADDHTEGISVHANYTLTFQSPKLAFFFPENERSTGEFHVLDIGLSKEYFDSVIDAPEYLEKKFIASLLKPRSKFSHKGNFGKSLLIAGSYGKMGAAVLAAKSCLRSGAGLLTVHVPASGYNIIQTSVPEAMCTTDVDQMMVTETGDVSKYSALGIGPGIGTSEMTSKFVLSLIGNVKQPMVIDADALNILSANKPALTKLSSNYILTPHPGEFERLAGKCENDFERNKLQRQFCEENNVVVILKGAYTCVMIPGGKTYFNSTGNPGMAKGGSGDALTGMILGFLSQGYSAEHASVISVYLHGLAGDLASIEKTETSLLASDLIEHIPHAISQIESDRTLISI